MKNENTPDSRRSALDELDALLGQTAAAPERSARPRPERPAFPGRLGQPGLWMLTLIAAVAGIVAVSLPQRDGQADDVVVEAEPVPSLVVVEPPVDPVMVSYPSTAIANSPRDGFVALRSAPSVRTGTRLLQIPHGAEVRLGTCDTPDIADRRSGVWCAAWFDGAEGYAFDGFLERY